MLFCLSSIKQYSLAFKFKNFISIIKKIMSEKNSQSKHKQITMLCVQGVTKSATDYLHISMKKIATNFFIIPLCLAAVYLDVFLRIKLIA